MLSPNLTINDAAGAAKTFNLVFQSGQESRRVDTSAPERLMAINHKEAGQPKSRYTNHNVNFSRSYVDGNGVTQKSAASITLNVSKDSTAAAFMNDLVSMLSNFINTAGVVAALERGES